MFNKIQFGGYSLKLKRHRLIYGLILVWCILKIKPTFVFTFAAVVSGTFLDDEMCGPLLNMWRKWNTTYKNRLIQVSTVFKYSRPSPIRKIETWGYNEQEITTHLAFCTVHVLWLRSSRRVASRLACFHYSQSLLCLCLPSTNIAVNTLSRSLLNCKVHFSFLIL